MIMVQDMKHEVQTSEKYYVCKGGGRQKATIACVILISALYGTERRYNLLERILEFRIASDDSVQSQQKKEIPNLGLVILEI